MSGRHFLQIPGPTNVPDRVLRAIDLLVDYGPALKMPHAEHLRGKLWELRIDGRLELRGGTMADRMEALVEDHKQNTLKLLAQIEEMQTSERELADLESRIRQAQDRVAQLRSRRRELHPAGAAEA